MTYICIGVRKATKKRLNDRPEEADNGREAEAVEGVDEGPNKGSEGGEEAVDEGRGGAEDGVQGAAGKDDM
jgi:hypothetical protein